MMQISENAPIRTVQTQIDKAKSQGLRVVHRPDNLQNNIIYLKQAAEQRRQRMCVSPEAA